MVVIKKIENVIPIDFGEFVLEFSVSDENLEKLDIAKKQYEESDLDKAEKLSDVSDVIKDIWITLFSEEDFNKVFNFAGQSTVNTTVYLAQTILGINTELEVRNSLVNVEEYL